MITDVIVALKDIIDASDLSCTMGLDLKQLWRRMFDPTLANPPPAMMALEDVHVHFFSDSILTTSQSRSGKTVKKHPDGLFRQNYAKHMSLLFSKNGLLSGI